MIRGWRYRAMGIAGTVALVCGAVLAANSTPVQGLVTSSVPLIDRLEPTVLGGPSLWWAVLLSVVVVGVTMIPLYKPRPRRLLDTVFLAQTRVLAGGLSLAAIGYFAPSFRLPRVTLALTVGLLVVAIPAWFVWIRRQPAGPPNRTLLVGDDRGHLERCAHAADAPVVGYLSPVALGERSQPTGAPVADGGVALEGRTASRELAAVESEGVTVDRLDTVPRLGELSRLEEILREYDVGTVVLAFSRPDRAAFFGALATCHDHGVRAKVHRGDAHCVLVSGAAVGELVDVDLEPWDPVDRLWKRLFDVAFATVGLVVFAPLFVVVAGAITLDSPGPVLYSQERTAGFGATFTVYKFRSMHPGSEEATPGEESARVTRVGRLLRDTHLDELPQLWSVLTGQMSVVGPRAAWVDEEDVLETEVPAWRKRWFVKPGLTGLAQINDATSAEPNRKLRYDLEYIRTQSIQVDLKIVLRQLWKVLEDVRRARR